MTRCRSSLCLSCDSSYRYAKNSVTFFSVCSLLHFEISRVAVSRFSPTTACGGGTGEASGAGTTRLAELQYLLRYGGLKQACPLSWARARLPGRLLRLLAVRRDGSCIDCPARQLQWLVSGDGYRSKAPRLRRCSWTR